jgi:hypothetical protein
MLLSVLFPCLFTLVEATAAFAYHVEAQWPLCSSVFSRFVRGHPVKSFVRGQHIVKAFPPPSSFAVTITPMSWIRGSTRTKSWYVKGPPGGGNQTKTKGPFTRDEILDMFSCGEFRNGELLFTDEQIFPNPDKPSSLRKVRLPDWCRWDQIPDPVRRKLEAAARHRVAERSKESGENEVTMSPEQPSNLDLFTIPGSSHSNTYPAL